MTKEERRKEWERQIAEWKGSGKSIPYHCIAKRSISADKACPNHYVILDDSITSPLF